MDLPIEECLGVLWSSREIGAKGAKRFVGRKYDTGSCPGVDIDRVLTFLVLNRERRPGTQAVGQRSALSWFVHFNTHNLKRHKPKLVGGFPAG